MLCLSLLSKVPAENWKVNCIWFLFFCCWFGYLADLPCDAVAHLVDFVDTLGDFWQCFTNKLFFAFHQLCADEKEKGNICHWSHCYSWLEVIIHQHSFFCDYKSRKDYGFRASARLQRRNQKRTLGKLEELVCSLRSLL